MGEKSAALFGTANVNVFIGAYFNYELSHKDITFIKFLDQVAPYRNEKQLKRHLEGLGFEVIRKAELIGMTSPIFCIALRGFMPRNLRILKSPQLSFAMMQCNYPS